MEKKFSIKDAFLFGFNAFCNNFFFIIGLMIPFGLMLFLPEVVTILFGIKIHPLINLVYSSVTGSMMMLCWIKFSLNCYDDTENKFDGLLTQWRLIAKYIAGYILYYVIIVTGSFLLILPGIYLSLRLFFYDYVIVDKNSSVLESFKKSWHITQGATWHLVVFFLASFGVFSVGLCLFLILTTLRMPAPVIIPILMISIFVSFFIIGLAWTFAYRKLLEGNHMGLEEQAAVFEGSSPAT